jgi:hypothetical protein
MTAKQQRAEQERREAEVRDVGRLAAQLSLSALELARMAAELSKPAPKDRDAA